MEFLHPDNHAGQTLLGLVARGSAVIAELLRLSDHVPSVFRGSPSDPAERDRHANILIDFRYLKTPEDFDDRIDKDTDLVDLDEAFRETHMALLERFYKVFESIFRYITDLNTYLEEMAEGVFVQHTVEGVLLDIEGRQLMCESLYLYGVMLLLMELRLPGPVREKMIISYYRYKGAATITTIDEVVKLCRSTGAVPGGKRPANYPEEFFARYGVRKSIVEMIIGRLRTDDIYNNSSVYPAPEHRSTALATQSGMLYVILYFTPDILHKKESVMREIVDKHYADNWVVPYYLGHTVDLNDVWDVYKAATTALKNTFRPQNIKEVLDRHIEILPKLQAGLDKYLTEGLLVDEYVLENVRKLLAHLRDCNVSLRWLFLHRTTTNKKFQPQIQAAAGVEQLMRLLLTCSQFEFLLKSMLKRLLDSKQGRWDECKREGADRMNELSEYFSGEKALTRVKKNEHLQTWFKQLANEIGALDYNASIVAGRKIAQLMQALEDVEEFHQIEASLQVKQFLKDTRGFLDKMIRTVNVSEKVVSDLDIISDFSYAWGVIHEYTPLLHQQIKAKPSICLLLRATFLKLSSILSLPLVRITQCQSKDDVSVADYYSGTLVAYVRGVLEVIPRSVFQILDSIIRLQTHELKELPTKMERKYLKDMSQLELRYTLAKYTHQVSVFTEGILAMNTTLLGIINLDPRQLLEDGIRKELVRQNATAMHEFLNFTTGKLEDFEARLEGLGKKLDGFRQSFEYIQDYISVYGLKIWQEEFSRIVNYNVEQESNAFLKKQILDMESTYQSLAIPIPIFQEISPPKGGEPSKNFMGRLVREVLRQTHPAHTVYVESNQGWYDGDVETVGIRTFDRLNKGVGIFGLTGMDKLLCFMIVKDLSTVVKIYRSNLTKPVSQFISSLTGELQPTSQAPVHPGKVYAYAQQKTQKLWPQFRDYIVKIGQAQLIRRQIANELNFTCQLDSKILYCSLDVMNKALLSDVEAHYTRPETHAYPSHEVLPEISKYLDTAGVNNPITKIYITTEPLEGLPLLIFLFVLSQITKLGWSRQLGTLVSLQKGLALDGAPLVVGVITLLKQFHSSHTHTFLGYLGQYVRVNISENQAKEAELPPVVINVLLFLELFCQFSGTSRLAIDAIIPAYIFDRFVH